MNFRDGIWVGVVAVLTLGCGGKQTDEHHTNPPAGGGGSGGTTGGSESSGGSGDTSSGGSSMGGDTSVGGAATGATGGSSTGGSSTGGSSTGGSSTGGSSTGGSSTGGSSTGGSGTAGSGDFGGSAGSAGSATGDLCTNTFGTPELLIADTPGVLRQSLSVTGDDLELYYEERRTDGAHLMLQKRTDRNAAFGAATELDSSIWAWCPTQLDPSLDVSDNGLRLYLTCVDTAMQNADGGYTSSAIRVAERATRDAAFVLRPDDFGTGNVSISVSQDELTAFWSDYTTTTNPLPVTATRASLSDPFGPATALPGITDSLRNPELADDGVHLFGSVQLLYANFHLFMFTRTSDNGDFLPITAQDIVVQQTGALQDDPSTPTIEGTSDYTPTVSGDCNSLYFMRRTVMADGSTTSEIFVAKR